MRRIAFVLAMASLLGWTDGSAQTPCPVPQLSVEGGTSSTTPCPPPSTSYTTSFDVTENPLSEGGKWSTGKATGLDWNNPETASGRAVASVRSGVTGSRYDDSVAHLRSTFINFQPNQYAQATVYRVQGYAPSGKHEVELLLRFDITAHNARGYEVLWGWDGDFAIVRWNGPLGDYTPLYSAILEQLVDGDVVRAEITAGVVRVFKNGALKATGPADSVFADGQPGIGFWPVDNSTPANYGWKDFEAGNL